VRRCFSLYLISQKRPGSTPLLEAIVALLPFACLAAVAGFILGLVISSVPYVLVQMTKHLFEPEPPDDTQREIRWLPDGREEI
jgi:hypothetical protein